MNKYDAKIYVTLRNGVNDPQGFTVKDKLNRLGYESLLDLRIGKYIEAEITAENKEAAHAVIREICDKVLANPVIENFKIDITEFGE
tara:strand:+ start:9726 stop:9986 length:261 start_codon:yes stop_codon:yes gene_type:complete